MTEAAIRAEEKMRAETEAENVEAAQWLAENGHATVTELTPEQIAVWQEATRPAVEQFRQEAGEAGDQLLTALDALR